MASDARCRGTRGPPHLGRARGPRPGGRAAARRRQSGDRGSRAQPPRSDRPRQRAAACAGTRDRERGPRSMAGGDRDPHARRRGRGPATSGWVFGTAVDHGSVVRSAETCDAQAVGFELVLIVAVVVLVVALVVESRRARRTTDHLRQAARALGTTPDGPSLVTAAEKLQLRAEGLETQLTTDTADLGTLGEALPVGLVRFATDGRVDLATASAHALLRARPFPPRTERHGDVRRHACRRTCRSSGVGRESVHGAPRAHAARTGHPAPGPSCPPVTVGCDLGPPRGCHRAACLQQIRAEFIDNLSHELRTPLSTVSLLAETLARDAEAAGRSRRRCVTGSARSRSRRATSPRWSTSCSTSRGSRAAHRSSWWTMSTWAGSRRARQSDFDCSPSGRT